MRKNIYLFLCCLFCISIATAQESTEIPEKEEIKKTRKNALAVSGGIPGYGFEYARVLNQHFSLRIGYNTLSVENYEIQDFEIDGQNTDIIANVDYSGIDFFIEYLPFKKSSFKLVFGAGYITDLLVTGNITFDEEQQIGDITLTKEDFGDLTLNADWSGTFAPYVGFGFGRAVPKRRLGLALEIGTYYANTPDVTLTATRLLTPTEEENRDTIQDGFESFKFIPNIKLRLAYSF
ncbi:hypothetical protein DUT90_07560 [Polaribacter sp. WD7]|uniref:hypothetical protein n=1 Tax=Polaribacter sp. WD7 TaxID=2269061 RepID=UPI000DF48250|nr:hypothetical protein [Polaribacter sp. WD7]RCS26964.1 hypothetical protein DUT90_07560 [Polaribacter sp. WD7]